MFSSRKAHVENTLRTVRYKEERLKCARPFLAPQETLETRFDSHCCVSHSSILWLVVYFRVILVCDKRTVQMSFTLTGLSPDIVFTW